MALLSFSNLNIDGSTVTFDINIEASGDNIYLGNSDFVLSFDNSAFDSPVFSMSAAGDFRTESDTDSDAAITQDNYLFNTATSIISGNLVINLSGPNPASMPAFERRVAKFPDGTPKKLGTFQITGFQSGDVSLGWIEASTLVSTITLPSFTEVPVTISTSSVLPVELVFFRAVVTKDNIVDLIWETATELNNDGFEVQYSRDGVNWSELTFVVGYGTINDPQQYAYQHRGAVAGNNYYRLKQMDFDGKFTYSDIEVVHLNVTSAKFSVYPNPAADTINIEIDPAGTNTIIRLHNQQGKIVHDQVIETGVSTATLQLHHLPAGTYIMNIMANNNNLQTEKIIIQR